MSISIVLRLDDTTARQIDAIVASLPDHHPTVPRYPPHITLGEYSDKADLQDIDAALATCTGSWKKLPITLAAPAVLRSPATTLVLIAITTAELLHRHMLLHKALADLGTHPSYEVNAWMPTIVLRSTDFLPDAIEVLMARWQAPIATWAVSLDLIRSEPMRLLSSRPLED